MKSKRKERVANVKINGVCYILSLYWVCHRKLTSGKGTILSQNQKAACKRGEDLFALHYLLKTKIAKLLNFEIIKRVVI